MLQRRYFQSQRDVSMPAQANGLVRAHANRRSPNGVALMIGNPIRTNIVNANESRRRGEDTYCRFGPPPLGLSTFHRTFSQAVGLNALGSIH